MTISINLHDPIVDVGAPIGHFLPQVADLLAAKAVIAPNHDVANAIGAITSIVGVEHAATIKPDVSGRYYIQGLIGNQ